MTVSRRVQRVEKELQHIVAKYLVRGYKGRLRGLVSVSRVESNPKLRTAKVYVSIMGSDEDRDASLESLKDHLHDIQAHVSEQLRMKYVPRISIVLDEGLHRLLRVESLLRDISLEKKSTDQNDSDEE
ncbi:MAG: 30S ribosome-binding factor RbfA [Bdellovibrionales bacterium]|nr:30S ribosome-binding factor RbfA [Bdellovibrionales bacterium]